MPGRIIALYVILCLRVLVNGVALVKVFPPSSAAAGFISTVGTVDFSACLFMLIALYQRKRWLIMLFRIYVAAAMPLSLLLMGASAFAKSRSGEPMAWNQFAGGVLAAVGFAVFAWYLGGARVREYLRGETEHGEPPVIETGDVPGQTTKPPTASGTPPSEQEPRVR